jgi:hypothetical protein
MAYFVPARCGKEHLKLGPQGIKHMWQTDGIKGLFKGNGLNCIRIFPNSAIKFLCYEQITRCGRLGGAAGLFCGSCFWWKLCEAQVGVCKERRGATVCGRSQAGRRLVKLCKPVKT